MPDTVFEAEVLAHVCAQMTEPAAAITESS